MLSAIVNKWAYVVEFLLSEPEINVDGITPDHISKSSQDIQKLFNNFSRKPKPILKDINQSCAHGHTIAHKHVNSRNVQAMRNLLNDPNLDLSIRERNGLTPIYYAVYYYLQDKARYDQIFQLLASSGKHCLSSTPYYSVRALFDQALSQEETTNNDCRTEVIKFILKNSTLMVTDEDIASASLISSELKETFLLRQGLQSTWDLKTLSGFKELPAQQNTKAEDVSKDANKAQFNYFNIFAPLALNVLFHITHKIVPVYISSSIALCAAYICKKNNKEEDKLNLYSNTMLASAASLAAYGFLNSKSANMQSIYGICTFVAGACYGYNNYTYSQNQER